MVLGFTAAPGTTYAQSIDSGMSEAQRVEMIKSLQAVIQLLLKQIEAILAERAAASVGAAPALAATPATVTYSPSCTLAATVYKEPVEGRELVLLSWTTKDAGAAVLKWESGSYENNGFSFVPVFTERPLFSHERVSGSIDGVPKRSAYKLDLLDPNGASTPTSYCRASI